MLLRRNYYIINVIFLVRGNFATLSIKATSAHTLVIVFFVNTHQGNFKNWKKSKTSSGQT
jgi:hypothetical protein